VLHTSIWGDWNFVWGAKPTKAPVATGLHIHKAAERNTAGEINSDKATETDS